MGQLHKVVRLSALAAIGVTLAGLAGGVHTASAAAKSKAPSAPSAPASEADEKKAATAAARQAYEAGVKSYSAGKFQPSIDQLSSALRGGGLGSAEMAKALYVRGLSYKKLSKPGLAISDLTSALWLKNGLGEADQKTAMAERAEAYRLAGLGDGNSGSDKVSVADPNPSPAGAKAPAQAEAVAPAPVATAPAVKGSKATAAAVPAAPIAPAAGGVTRQAPDSQAAIDAANARRNAAVPVELGGLQSAASATVIGNSAAPAIQQNPTPQASAAPAATAVEVAAATPALTAPLAAPPAATPTAPVLSAAPINGMPPIEAPVAQPGVPNTISGFFSNIFGGGSQATAAQQASTVTTASTTPPAAASNWAGSTSVASTGNKKPETAAVRVAAPAAVAVPGGKYKLHIAAVRSRSEADALAQKLAQQQGAALKSRMPVVDEAVIGSMGTFYRVRVGSFASPDESRGVCNTLRSSGFDCLVVTN